jgi:hypothetical protein
MNESLFWVVARSNILCVDRAMHELVDWSVDNMVKSTLSGPANMAVVALTTLRAVPLPDPPNLDEFLERERLPCFQG